VQDGARLPADSGGEVPEEGPVEGEGDGVQDQVHQWLRGEDEDVALQLGTQAGIPQEPEDIAGTHSRKDHQQPIELKKEQCLLVLQQRHRIVEETFAGLVHQNQRELQDGQLLLLIL
jgi:hypothetical protein